MRRQTLLSTVVSIATCSTSLACTDPLGADDPRLTFDASPDTVLAGDTVDLVFTLRNRTRYPVTVRSSAGCLFFLETLKDGEPVPWKGTDYACTAAITDFEIPAWDSLHFVHRLVAAPAGGPAGGGVPAGTYRIRALMNIAMADLETEVAVLEAPEAAVR